MAVAGGTIPLVVNLKPLAPVCDYEKERADRVKANLAKIKVGEEKWAGKTS